MGHVNAQITLKNLDDVKQAKKENLPEHKIRIITFVVIIWFLFTSCDNDTTKDELDGTTWKASVVNEDITTNYFLTFNSPNFTWSSTYEMQTQTITGQIITGTYSISGSNVILKGDNIPDPFPGTLSGNNLDFRTNSGYGPLFTKQ